SAMMIISFVALYFLAEGPNGEPLNTFSMIQLNNAQGIAHTTALLIFGGMFLGFGIKVPMFPFHTWLPDAHTEAPTVGSVILAAVRPKPGNEGLMRVAIPILPDAAHSWAPFIALLAVIGIIYGALCCLAQTDMKRLIPLPSVDAWGLLSL